MKFDLRHLESFVAVAEELHFGRAAARLHLAQPALSQQILRLEAALGVDLLVRERRRTALSDVGRLFLVEARRTLEQARVAESVAERARRGEVGRLRVGYHPTASSQLFLTALSAFERAVPDVELSLRELPMGVLGEPLYDDTVDVAFLSTFGEIDCGPGALRMRTLSSERFLLAAPTGHALSTRDDVALRDVEGETLVMLGRDVCAFWHDDLLAMCGRGGYTPKSVRYAGELGTQLTLVAAGLGVALVQETSRMVRTDGIDYVPVRDADQPVISAAIWRANDSSPALARFLDLLPEVTPGQPDHTR
ncbi:LysR substrate-binding domain-containing protein [Actinomadura madurae]|uniref:LysR substrate-binding domain-containing protein n=1 Tax=Actinomadura madurae TaxID=1993 RepID=UPI002026DE88|nr:LysR substrate-binding domain-containing protein [Actinomadura madurae]URM97456.1 LysR substrate-binding domain-containing protein [Actinomadura madurae]URN08148.1 LysR substrate-binding domain-containing protein [Actinomadura madurae]